MVAQVQCHEAPAKRPPQIETAHSRDWAFGEVVSKRPGTPQSRTPSERTLAGRAPWRRPSGKRSTTARRPETLTAALRRKISGMTWRHAANDNSQVVGGHELSSSATDLPSSGARWRQLTRALLEGRSFSAYVSGAQMSSAKERRRRAAFRWAGSAGAARSACGPA